MIATTPTPDPAPHTGTRHVTQVPITIIVPARDPEGNIIHGYKFKCILPVNGVPHCFLFSTMKPDGSTL